MRQKFMLILCILILSGEGINYSQWKRITTCDEINVRNRTIDRTKDDITITLAEVVTDKKGGIPLLQSEEGQAGVKIKITINGTNGNLQKPDKSDEIVINQIYLVNISSLPVSNRFPLNISNKLLINGFRLADGTYDYTSLTLDFDLIKKRGTSPFGIFITQMDNFTKTVPFPKIPFLDETKTIYTLINNMLDPTNDEENKINNDVHFGTIDMNLNPGAASTGNNIQETGAIALFLPLQDEFQSEDGYVDVTNLGQYEFKYQTNPGNVLVKAGDKFVQVYNNYILLFVDAHDNSKTIVSSKTQSKDQVIVKVTKQDMSPDIKSKIINQISSNFTTLKLSDKKSDDLIQYLAKCSQFKIEPDKSVLDIYNK